MSGALSFRILSGLFREHFGHARRETFVPRLSNRARLHYAPAMGSATRLDNQSDAGRTSARATCVRCNTEVDLSAKEVGQIRDAGVGSFRRHLIVVDTACRECGTNQRKMVVSVVGR